MHATPRAAAVEHVWKRSVCGSVAHLPAVPSTRCLLLARCRRRRPTCPASLYGTARCLRRHADRPPRDQRRRHLPFADRLLSVSGTFRARRGVWTVVGASCDWRPVSTWTDDDGLTPLRAADIDSSRQRVFIAMRKLPPRWWPQVLRVR